ncbi:TPA: hypothetical protein HA338_01930 [Methanosarcina acetivorans]|uniref:Uncharacterized protein n=2 Tax=Methanosarcina acetivorans TaxID=2214 RepID=Q8TI86_METAC|nr:hypothetical protein [Methanosarcina acetivorans]AAM07614.1 predicted protein [Methanosarcina acetivorans C2A]HIH92835.1 hypothetical protein [Methanosarcina acetivorans]
MTENITDFSSTPGENQEVGPGRKPAESRTRAPRHTENPGNIQRLRTGYEIERKRRKKSGKKGKIKIQEPASKKYKK